MGRLHALFLAIVATTSAAGWASGVPVEPDYEPGKLDVLELEMYLSKGLTAQVIAIAGQPVTLGDGITTSTEPFHTAPDGAAVFAADDNPNTTNNNNPGGWIYVSNSEADNHQGGVGAITFNAQGDVIGYQRLLTGTNRNCNGGKTDWNTWISCEGRFYVIVC